MKQKDRSGSVTHKQTNSRPNFQTWLIRTKPEWTWNAAHQKAICRALTDAWGTSKRLMVFMPPRHGKSEMVTVRYAAWRLEQRPSMRILICCHTQRLANLFSRKIRRIVSERVKLGRERSAVNEWETPEGGGVTAIGVGGGLAGIGADLVIVDDPIRNRSDAESQYIRQSAAMCIRGSNPGRCQF